MRALRRLAYPWGPLQLVRLARLIQRGPLPIYANIYVYNFKASSLRIYNPSVEKLYK